MPMYNLLEYRSDYSDIKDDLCFYSKDEATNFNADFVDGNVFNSFKYKAKLLGNYSTKKELEHATGVATSNLAAKSDFNAL